MSKKRTKAQSGIFDAFIYFLALVMVYVILYEVFYHRGEARATITNETFLTDIMLCYDGEELLALKHAYDDNNWTISYNDNYIAATVQIFVPSTGKVLEMEYRYIESDWQLRSHGWN